jgi:hypothetical protein
MATILKGKDKGREAEIVQWGIDWFHVKLGIEEYKIVKPTNLQFTAKEIMLILQSDQAEQTLLTEYKPTFDFRFERIKRRTL